MGNSNSEVPTNELLELLGEDNLDASFELSDEDAELNNDTPEEADDPEEVPEEVDSESGEDPEEGSAEDDDPDDDSDDDPGEDPKQIDDVLDVYFAQLMDLGVLDVPDDYKFDGTEESLKELLEEREKTTQEKALQSFYEKLPEDFQQVLSYAVNGGTSMEDFVKSYQQETDYENAPIDTDEQQKKIIKSYYKLTTKYSDDKIDTMLERLEKLDDLEAEAADARDYLSENAKKHRDEIREKQEQLRAEQEEAYKQNIKNTQELIQSTPEFKGKRGASISAFMLNQTKREGNLNTDYNRVLKNIASNKAHEIQLASLLYENYDPKTGFNFKGLHKKAKTKATSDFRKILSERINTKSKPLDRKRKDKKVSLPWDEILEN